MKIYGNCLVKNEVDMIEETLSKAAVWCDRIFVFDNGSTDGTWEKVLALSQQDNRIVPFKQEAVPFRNSLRRDVFESFRKEVSNDDWWCILDADEIYIDNPREFLAIVPLHDHVVWGVFFQHYFTDADATRYALNQQAYPPYSSAESGLQYYRCEYSEVRFYRHRRSLVWSHGSAPLHLGIVHPRRIRFKHYQYRSPPQMQQRLATRQLAMKQGCENFAAYSSEIDWRQKIVASTTCRHASEPNAYAIDESAVPRHLESPVRRMIKRFMHQTGLWP